MKITRFIGLFIIILVNYSLSFGNSYTDSLETQLKVAKGEEYTRTLIRITEAYRNLSSEKSIDYGILAIESATKIGDEALQAEAYFTSGYACYALNKHDQALTYFDKAMQLYKKTGNKKGISSTYNRLGNTQQLKGDYSKALDYYNEALVINESLSDFREIARTLTNISSVYRLFGYYEKAFECDFRALKTYEDIKDQEGIAWSLLNIARLYNITKEYTKALDYIQRSKANYDRIEKYKTVKTGVTLCLSELGKIYHEKGDLDKALEYTFQVLELNKTSQNTYGIANTLSTIGKIYYEQGKYDKALEYLQQCILFKDTLKSFPELAAAYRYLGYTHLKTNNIIKAQYYLDLSLTVAKEQNLRAEIRDIYFTQMEVFAKTGNYRQALDYYKAFISLKDSLNDKEIGQLEIQYEFEKKQKQIEFDQQQKEIIHKEQLHRQMIIRNWFIIAFVLMVLIVVLIYKGYQQKKKTNRILNLQNEQINTQKKEIEKQRDLATQQRDQITKQKQLITDSIHYASRIQHAVMEHEVNIDNIIPERFVLYKPKDIVSGDFYWISQQQERIYIAVADCTGHGVPGAFMSLLGITFLNEIISKKQAQKPADILNTLRSQIITSLHQTGKQGEAKDGLDIALCMYDIPSKTLHFAGAYNPLYIIRKNLGDVKASVVCPEEDWEKMKDAYNTFKVPGNEFNLFEVKADKMPIGIFIKPQEESFRNHVIKVEQDDVFFLFSDGYPDQFGGPNREKLTYAVYKESLIKAQVKSVTEQGHLLESSLESWKGKNGQTDDILVLGFKLP